MIFISAIHLTEIDRLRGYEMGAVDYVPVPVIPEVLRAKVRCSPSSIARRRQLERMNAELEERVVAAHRRARSLDPRCSKASRAAASRLRPATWAHGIGIWSPANVYGTTANTASMASNREHFAVTPEKCGYSIHPEDWDSGCKAAWSA